MEGHAKKCVERNCELANKTTQQLYKVSTPCINDHHFKVEEMNSVGELSHVCSQIVLKCLYLARIRRPDILWSVIKHLSHVVSKTNSTAQRLLRYSSRSPPATAGPRTCMTRRSVTAPSAERSLHRCSLRSEKNQRAADKLTTLLEESLLSSHSLSVGHVRTGRPVDEFGSLLSNVRQNP